VNGPGGGPKGGNSGEFRLVAGVLLLAGKTNQAPDQLVTQGKMTGWREGWGKERATGLKKIRLSSYRPALWSSDMSLRGGRALLRQGGGGGGILITDFASVISR